MLSVRVAAYVSSLSNVERSSRITVRRDNFKTCHVITIASQASAHPHQPPSRSAATHMLRTARPPNLMQMKHKARDLPRIATTPMAARPSPS